MTQSATSITRTFLSQNPNIAYCLRRGLINYSSLAREICEEIGDEKFDAVVAACRRLRTKLKNQKEQERLLTRLLKRARLRVKNKMSVVIIRKPRDLEKIIALQRKIRRDRGTFQFIEGEDAVTLIMETHDLEIVRSTFLKGIKKVTSGLSQILMIFDQNIETTPGVVAHLFALLGGNSINVYEEMSCWKDVMLMVAEKESSLAIELLSGT